MTRKQYVYALNDSAMLVHVFASREAAQSYLTPARLKRRERLKLADEPFERWEPLGARAWRLIVRLQDGTSSPSHFVVWREEVRTS